VGECAVRMVRAGASLVGVNCLFDPYVCLEVRRLEARKWAREAFNFLSKIHWGLL